MSTLRDYLPYLIAGLSTLLSIVTSAHAVMYKRESRAAAGWVGLIWLSPFVGPMLYVLLGVNRVRRRAVARLQRTQLIRHELADEAAGSDASTVDALEQAIDRVAVFHRRGGNSVAVLKNGDEAYPAMHESIESAKHRIHLCTYIFDADRAGRELCEALGAAVERGVEVRVIVDHIGARYSFPSIISTLRKNGVDVVRFGRTRWPWNMRYANLRNHRKILVVDDHTAFTGGMNIRQGNVLAWKTKNRTADLHFRMQGPIVHQLDTVFADDWELVTGQRIDVAPLSMAAKGPTSARCLPDGPDAAVDSIRRTMLAGIACSQKRVRIVTPYFVPDAGLIAALCTAAMRGVNVEIVLPETNNLRLVQWAATAQLWQVLEQGCDVFYSRGPFDHTKLMLVDDSWCLLGSANWDARSLRLNFEANVECCDSALAAGLHALVDRRIGDARQVTLEDVDSRHPLVRLRDGLARLLAPYL